MPGGDAAVDLQLSELHDPLMLPPAGIRCVLLGQVGVRVTDVPWSLALSQQSQGVGLEEAPGTVLSTTVCTTVHTEHMNGPLIQ